MTSAPLHRADAEPRDGRIGDIARDAARIEQTLEDACATSAAFVLSARLLRLKQPLRSWIEPVINPPGTGCGGKPDAQMSVFVSMLGSSCEILEQDLGRVRLESLRVGFGLLAAQCVACTRERELATIEQTSDQHGRQRDSQQCDQERDPALSGRARVHRCVAPPPPPGVTAVRAAAHGAPLQRRNRRRQFDDAPQFAEAVRHRCGIRSRAATARRLRARCRAARHFGGGHVSRQAASLPR